MKKRTYVRGEFGLVILPDGCTETIADSYDEVAWSALEKQGAVFLPSGGWRDVTETKQYGSVGYYWTSTSVESDDTKAYDYCYTKPSEWNILRIDKHTKYDGFSVRLVRF